MKLDGTAPHMKGIDMSKDPYCAKYHANSPAQLELVVVGKNSGLENVVLYLSQGLPADAASQKSSASPVFDQKGCMYTPHVIAMNPGEDYKVTTSDQTAHNIHPEPNPMTGQHSVEPLPAAGSAADRAELEGRGSGHPGEV